MTEVLYTMRNGKIVDPNIPMDGLICYLDARGKTNNDIYKNVLLDLSGNGNHGTLRNFNFTEQSGYVKDLSGGTSGLVFDGVDDMVTYTHNIATRTARTICLDFNMDISALDQGVWTELPFGLSIHNVNNLIYFSGTSALFNHTDYPITKGRHKLIVTGKDIVDSAKMYYKGEVRPCVPQSSVGSPLYDALKIEKRGKKTIHKAMLYNRVLTEQEIQQLIGG